MKIVLHGTYEDMAKKLLDVQAEHKAFSEEVEKILKVKKDGRLYFLKIVDASIASSCISFLSLFHRAVVQPGFATVREVSGEVIPNDSLRTRLNLSDNFLRISWCSAFQFYTETLFKNIIRALGGKVPHRYGEIVDKLASMLNLSQRQNKMLNIFAHMRNSMHSNGIHTNKYAPQVSITINGYKYQFRYGRKVRCSSWFHIANLWKGLIPIYRKIYFHSKLRRINNIPHVYIP